MFGIFVFGIPITLGHRRRKKRSDGVRRAKSRRAEQRHGHAGAKLEASKCGVV